MRGGVGAACAQMHKDIVLQPWDTLKISVPALLYTVQNNLLYFALKHLDAAPYQARRARAPGLLCETSV